MACTIQQTAIALAIALTTLLTGCASRPSYSLIEVRNEVGVLGVGGTNEYKTFHVRVNLATGEGCTIDGNGYAANLNGRFIAECKGGN